MEDGWKNGVVEDVVVAGEVHENLEAAGGLKTRSRKNRLLEKGGEVEGDAAVAGEQGRGVYLVQEEGVKSLNETNGVGLKEVEQLLTNKSLPNCEADCITEQAEDFSAKENHYDCEDLKMKNHEICEEECGRTLTGTEAGCENIEQVALPQESEVAVELDLERILEEQETHDLYCPNCHSCITKRVILRKRKRTDRVKSDPKREKIEPVQADLIANTSAAETTGETHDKEPDVFRCLSCLSFFIPTDIGFRLFHVSGKREENENLQSSQQMSGRNQNWLFSLIDLMIGKNKGSKLEKETDTTSPALGEQTPSTFHAIIEENQDAKGEYLSDKEDSQISLGSNLEKDAQMNIVEKLANGTQNEARNDVNKVSLYNPPSEWVGHLPDEKRIASVLTEQWPINISDSIGRQVEHVDQESIEDVQVPANNRTPLFEKIKIEEEKLQVPKEGGTGDGIISVEEGMIKPIQEVCLKGPSISDLSIPIPVVPGVRVHSETHIDLEETMTEPLEETMAEPTKTHQWDVLKAIVYGGLLESIASLGVISSAAGSDVTTLNVIALGMANLVSGLLVVIHNLVELKKEQYKSINSKEAADRYWELLGTRGHFWLHATVTLLSYILVGTLPLIIYGFSFRESDSKEYKMIVVSAASLFCIAFLAIGKAHVQEGQKTYLKTFLYYIGLGIGSSCLSYAIGMLIKKLLEELGLFDDTVLVPSPPLSTIFEVTSRTPSWWSF